MSSKPVYTSKTLWINLILAALAIFAPPAKAVVDAHPEAVALAFSVINMVLRLVTKTQLQLS